MTDRDADVRDDFEIFLDTWKPSALAEHATLPQYLDDPYTRAVFFEHNAEDAAVRRTPWADGDKEMEPTELAARNYDFFVRHQAEWSAGFREHALENGVPKIKLDAFCRAFATDWLDGMARRQDTPLMRSVKASIRDHDRAVKTGGSRRFVLNPVDDDIEALFTPDEMAAIFQANSGLMAAYLPDYLDSLGDDGLGGLATLHVRRGVHLQKTTNVRQERFELSSYSFGLGAVEQFAVKWTRKTKQTGVPTITSAPLPAVQQRTVAFAPFIADMTLKQLEIVVAPPLISTPLVYHGQHGGIEEFTFE